MNDQQPRLSGVVVSRSVYEELRDHPNATPERLEYLEHAATRAENPAAFVIAGIRGAYQIPENFKDDRDKEQRKRWLHELAQNKSRQDMLVREFQAGQLVGGVPQRITFGEWAWDRFGRTECRALHRESA